jgi:UDP-glucose:(heptosyl)LPS alpha-1,3-glucosyltransferase
MQQRLQHVSGTSFDYTVVLVVRGFHPKGGMESYVWRLAQALVRRAMPVVVLCCDACPGFDRRVVVRTLRLARFGSSWARLMVFSGMIARFMASNRDDRFVIHSHERTSIHHITTFHGPPFALIHTYPFWRRWSLRVWAYLWMERREVCGRNVLAVVPNSAAIGATLQRYYPCIGSRLRRPISPGVEEVPIRAFRRVALEGGVVGFVGKEWRRKGLETVIRICRELSLRRPELVLRIYGPEPRDISILVKGCGFNVQIMGWKDAKPELHELDLLLHPARSEPYGMVISEAMAAQVPVVVSDACGAAADVSASNGIVLPIDSSIEDWAKACDEMLSLTQAVPAFRRSWDDVAREHIALYEEVAKQLAAVKPRQ